MAAQACCTPGNGRVAVGVRAGPLQVACPGWHLRPRRSHRLACPPFAMQQPTSRHGDHLKTTRLLRAGWYSAGLVARSGCPEQCRTASKYGELTGRGVAKEAAALEVFVADEALATR